MAIELVPAGDNRCDVCAGNRDRPKPKPGERWSERETVSTMCQACFADLSTELHLDSELTYGTDPEGRRWIDRRPEDPSKN
jgi:hypothetical protein